jgi:hypothetical protein
MLVGELPRQMLLSSSNSSFQVSRPVVCVGLVVISRGFLTRDWRSRARGLDTFHVASQLGDTRLDSGHT